MTTTISTDQNIVTLINVLTVDKTKQQELIDLLIEATETVMNKMSGYVSANIHMSLDGTKVANYVQWKTEADFHAMLRNPDALAHMAKASVMASAEPMLYRVAYTDSLSK